MSQQPWRQQPGPAGGCFTCGGPHRKQYCPRRMSQQPAGKRGGKGKGKGKGKTVNPNAIVQCHKCGRWGHKQVNCRVVADVEHPEQDSEEQEVEALIGGLGDAGDPWPLIYGITPSHSRRRRNRTPMLNGLGPIDVEVWPVDIRESEEEIDLEKEYVCEDGGEGSRVGGGVCRAGGAVRSRNTGRRSRRLPDLHRRLQTTAAQAVSRAEEP